MGTANPTPSPVNNPAIVIGGRTFTLKYSLLADFVLDKRGIDTSTLIPVLKAAKPGTKSLVIELFAACVAHNFVEAGEKAVTAEEWCLRLDAPILLEVGQKIFQALFPNLPAPAAGAEGEVAAAPVQ